MLDRSAIVIICGYYQVLFLDPLLSFPFLKTLCDPRLVLDNSVSHHPRSNLCNANREFQALKHQFVWNCQLDPFVRGC